VLLLEFPDSKHTLGLTGGINDELLREVGETGLYLKYPKIFMQQHSPPVNNLDVQLLKNSVYEMRDNGVLANIRYAEGVDAQLTLETLQQQIYQQLEQVEGMTTLQVSQTPVRLGDVDGVHLVARYDMPPFGKQVDYHVIAAIKNTNVWRVTVTLKDCDRKGQRQVNDMLASLVIFPR